MTRYMWLIVAYMLVTTGTKLNSIRGVVGDKTTLTLLGFNHKPRWVDLHGTAGIRAVQRSPNDQPRRALVPLSAIAVKQYGHHGASQPIGYETTVEVSLPDLPQAFSRMTLCITARVPSESPQPKLKVAFQLGKTMISFSETALTPGSQRTMTIEIHISNPFLPASVVITFIDRVPPNFGILKMTLTPTARSSKKRCSTALATLLPSRDVTPRKRRDIIPFPCTENLNLEVVVAMDSAQPLDQSREVLFALDMLFRALSVRSRRLRYPPAAFTFKPV